MTFRFFMAACAVGVLGLAGCGSDKNPVFEAGKTFAKTIGKKQQAAPMTRDGLKQVLTPALRAQIGAPIVLVENEKAGASAAMIQAGINGATATYMTQDRNSIALKGGVLTATRGLGFDLMASDVEQPIAALRARGRSGQAVRIMHFLDGENKEIIRSFVCDYTAADADGMVRETCVSPQVQFVNQFWLGQGGKIRLSRQWAGPQNGYLIIEPV